MKKGIFLSLLIPFTTVADYKIHVLKEGETLSGLLKSYGYTPLYTEDGWVKKTLEMNHLTMNQAKDIKKGFPVILPTNDPPKTREKIIYKNKVITKYDKKPTKYFGISDHQEVQFSLMLGRQEYQFENANNLGQESYQAGFHVIGKNNYQIGKFRFNYNAGIDIKGYGPALDNNNDQSISLRPDYQISAGILTEVPLIPFRFGLNLIAEERSVIEENEGFDIRRDQNIYLGFKVDKRFDLSSTDIHTNLSYNQNIIQEQARGFERYEASEFDFNLGFNFTENTILGLNYNTVSFEQANIQNIESTSVNFTYSIK